ncbi:MAG TPA: UDP-N-acetylmuramoyl-tripeptide--D-alanyl-D-alanine ligase [Gammaproteobacteria bacterium]|nr:UDP-N-acetylmuramoyl-tripeptide--D-alanyl-D-alanine ligase [Gammaproteobacteria bacterium]
MIDLKELARLLGKDCDSKLINKFCHDSRNIKAEDVYIALKGQRVDGHDYVLEAERAGAIAVIVERLVKDINIPQFVVKSSLHAWQKIARFIREKSSARVIGITGSCGKTTVKSLLGHVLSSIQPTLVTSGNFNNEIGVPLTLSGLQRKHRYAVIEMGARKKGDICVLCQCVQPDIGLITCSSEVHLESFGNITEVIKTKGELFQTMKKGVAIYPKSDRGNKVWTKYSSHLKTFQSSLENPYRLEMMGYDNHTMKVRVLDEKGCEHTFDSQLLGRHSLHNLSLVLAVTAELGIMLVDVIKAFKSYTPEASRQRLYTLEKISLIDDSYNASPASVKAAMQTLKDVSDLPVFILGDMAELGEHSSESHKDIASYARSLDICLYYVGEYRDEVRMGYGSDSGIYSKYTDLIENLVFSGNELVWVKGSRKSKMERVVNYLRERYSC